MNLQPFKTPKLIKKTPISTHSFSFDAEDLENIMNQYDASSPQLIQNKNDFLDIDHDSNLDVDISLDIDHNSILDLENVVEIDSQKMASILKQELQVTDHFSQSSPIPSRSFFPLESDDLLLLVTSFNLVESYFCIAIIGYSKIQFNGH